MANPSTSIIISGKNPDPRQLDDTLQSAILQDCKSPFNVIYVDDYSILTEGVKLARKIDGVAVRELPFHHGKAGARNAGANTSTSKYLMFLNVGDVLDQSYLSHTVQALEKNKKAPFAYTSTQLFGHSSECYEASEQWQNDIWKENKINPSILMRRGNFNEVGGWAETWPLFVKLSRLGKPVACPKAVLYSKKLHTRIPERDKVRMPRVLTVCHFTGQNPDFRLWLDHLAVALQNLAIHREQRLKGIELLLINETDRKIPLDQFLPYRYLNVRVSTGKELPADTDIVLNVDESYMCSPNIVVELFKRLVEAPKWVSMVTAEESKPERSGLSIRWRNAK